MNSIFKRVSVRNYLEKPVEQEKIDSIMRAAMASPSAGNQRPWEFYIVKNREVLDKLSQVSPYAGFTNKADFAIVTCYKVDELVYKQYAEIDMSACCENILLEVVEQGLGAVWLGIAPMDDRMQMVEEILNIPANLRVFSIIPVGYAVEEKLQQNRYDENRIHYIL